jgi:hypothetical protein
MALQPFVGARTRFQFLVLYTVGRTPWTGDEPVARPLPTHRTIHALSGIRTDDPSVRAGEDGSGPSHTSAQNSSVLRHFVTAGNCGRPENMCCKETVLSQTIMDIVARFHKVRYNGRILSARVAPASFMPYTAPPL